MATEREAVLLTEGWGAPITDACENCGSQEVQVWEIGGCFICSAECALKSIPGVGWVTFEDYLWDLRLKANLADIYDAIHAADG